MRHLILLSMLIPSLSSHATDTLGPSEGVESITYQLELPQTLKAVDFAENVFRGPFQDELQQLILKELILETKGETKKIDVLAFIQKVEKEAKEQGLGFEGLREELFELFKNYDDSAYLNKSLSISGNAKKKNDGSSSASISVSGSKKVNGVKVSGSISNTTSTTRSGNTSSSTSASITITFP